MRQIIEVNARCSYFTKWLLELDRCKNKIFCPVVRTDELKLFVNKRVLSVPPKINATFYYLSPNNIPLATWENGKERSGNGCKSTVKHVIINLMHSFHVY